MNPAEQCRALGFKVGDTIEGRESYGTGWNIVRLTVLWLGERTAVFREQAQYSNNPGVWTEPEEASNWTLEMREWKKISSAAAPQGAPKGER